MPFDWLTTEIASVRSRRFFILEPPSALPADVYPPDYREFLAQLGTARLFRQFDFYLVGVRAPEASSVQGHSIIGHRSCFLASLRSDPSDRQGIYEHRRGSVVFVAPDFGTWLRNSCGWARKQYRAREWRAIVAGPAPFSASEEAVVVARRQFAWELVGVSASGELQFSVTNNSALTLPYLTVGLRDSAGTFQGGVWLPVAAIPPGSTELVSKRGYDSLVPPESLRAFAVPDPIPEERDRYWEFRGHA